MRYDKRRMHKVLNCAVLTACALSVAYAGACANVTEPPGGPPDELAPIVMSISPDSGAIVEGVREVTLQFDEVVSETPKGAQNLSSLVFISPKSGFPDVSWKRSRIVIKPSDGWKPNTVYSVAINPGITDLRNNSIDSVIRLVFSTGGPIPDTKISGAIFDWVSARGAAKGLVEALAIDSATKDTTFYQALADSSGRYQLTNLPAGPYLLRGILDRNLNRELEPLEQWDTLRVTATQNATADLYTFVHDTAGIRISTVTELDSGKTLRVTFDKPYAPGQLFTPERAVVALPDSSTLAVLKLQSPFERAQDDSLRNKARADSISKANIDTSAAGRARADTLARQRTADSVANVERQRREQQRLDATRGRRPVVRDTVPPPKFQRPLLYNELFVTLATPVPPATRVRVTILALPSLSGVSAPATREFVTHDAPKDTTGRSN